MLEIFGVYCFSAMYEHCYFIVGPWKVCLNLTKIQYKYWKRNTMYKKQHQPQPHPPAKMNTPSWAKFMLLKCVCNCGTRHKDHKAWQGVLGWNTLTCFIQLYVLIHLGESKFPAWMWTQVQKSSKCKHIIEKCLCCLFSSAPSSECMWIRVSWQNVDGEQFRCAQVNTNGKDVEYGERTVT